MAYRLFRELCDFPIRIYNGLYYCWLESSHRASVAWNRHSGVIDRKRNQELIVSLTTIPERIGKVSLCVDSLLRQSVKPDRVILWLSESDDPTRPRINRKSLPPDLVDLQNRGLEIRWCRDIRSFRKIVPTLREFPRALIITADDDIFYPSDWLRMLYEAYQREPQYIHSHRAHLIKYDSTGAALPYRQWGFEAPGVVGPSVDLCPTSGGGVLYAPGHLHHEVMNESVFLELCPTADDVWLKAMSLLSNVSCKKVKPVTFRIVDIRIPNNRTLASENLDRDQNDQQIRALAREYGVFRRIF